MTIRRLHLWHDSFQALGHFFQTFSPPFPASHLKGCATTTLLIALAMSSLVSCASRKPVPPPGGPTSLLQTRITEGGLKLFEVGGATREGDKPVAGGPSSPPSQGKQRPKSAKFSAKQMEKRLDEIMELSGFCRDGYVILGRYAGETTSRIRGECRDIATEEDRLRFPDTIQRW